jgi:hypothetical protein
MAADATPPAAASTRARLFLSYSRKDAALVDRLAAALAAQGYEALLDRTNIAAGEEWKARLAELIARADTVVVLLSPDWLASPVCAWEAEAERRGKRLLPALVRAVDDARVPAALAKLNWSKLDPGEGFERGATALADALATDLPWVREHTRIGEAADAWTARGRPAALLLRGQRLAEAERWLADRPADVGLPTEAHRAFVAASRRGATRRQRFAVGGAVAVALVAGSLALLAEVNRRDAEAQRAAAVAQRETAQRNFALARSTVNEVLFEFAQGFKHTEGVRADVIARVLARARASLETLTAAAPDDHELRRMGYGFLLEFGDAVRRAGDRAQALDLYAQGLERARAAIAALPDAPRIWRRDQIAFLQRIGDARLEAGDVTAGLAAHEEALALARPLAAEAADALAASDLAQALDGLGKAKLRMGDADGAEAAFGESATIRRALFAAAPGDAARRDLLGVLDSLGELARGRRDEAGARAAFEEGLGHARALAASDPANALWRRDLAIMLERLGQIALANEPRRALDLFEESLSLRRALGRLDAQDAALKREIGLILVWVGDARRGARTGSAREAYEEASALARGLARADPANVDLARELGVALARLGGERASAGDREAALAAYEEGLANDRALAGADDPARRRDVAIGLARIGELRLAGGDREGARSALAESADIRRALNAASPRDDLRLGLVVTLWTLVRATDDAAARRSKLVEARALLAAEAAPAWAALRQRLIRLVEAALASPEAAP